MGPKQKRKLGILGPRTKYAKAMGKYPSIFQVEIHATERHVQFNLSRRCNNQDIAILLDSQAVIKVLNSPITTFKLMWDCLGKLNELVKNKVTLLWRQGRNECPDKLAGTERNN